ncbi:MAG: GCN5-related N-acetyltransferase [Chthonomonadaceae bacterium]|nr:GCN5-related N-acetyltransferase [Chthonomonadaceae bacterium]
MLEVGIRPETASDAGAIQEVTELAFGRAYEAGVVEKVRRSSGFVSELSLVAEREGEIVGHVMFSELEIVGASESWTVLALGPISVRPEFQKQGVGRQMIRAGLERAANLGYGVVVLIGHPTYYPRFGFASGSRFGLKCAIPVPDDVFMAHLLRSDGLDGIEGTVVFPPAFQE